MMYVSLAACVYLLYPRFATWRIKSMRYATMTVGLDLSTNIELEIGVQVYVSRSPRQHGPFVTHSSPMCVNPTTLVPPLDPGPSIVLAATGA
jgi:hypothetical protein